VEKLGEWLQWRRDSQRTGRALLSGKISEPDIFERYYLGGMEDWIVLKIDHVSSSELVLNTEEKKYDEDEIRREWGIDRWIDIEGKGIAEKVVETERERYLKISPDDKGFKRLYFESAFDKGMQGDDTRGWLEERIDGKWRRVWTTPPDNHYWRPNILLSDIDGDGEDEIVLTAHYRIMAFNRFTGEKLRELKYHNYRNYGDVHAVDFTGNGLCDFLQITFFPAHLEVILNDGKEFKVAWFEDVQQGDITDSEHAIISPYYPIADIDSDGKLEIVYSRFNEKGDNKWHTLVLEPLTGKVKYDIPDFVAQDMLALDGKLKLFGVRSTENYVPSIGGAAIYEIIDGNIKLYWEDEKISWCMWSPYPWENYASSRSLRGDRKTIATLHGGKVILCYQILSEDRSLYKLISCSFDEGSLKVFSEVYLPEFIVRSVKYDVNEILITTKRGMEEFHINSCGGKIQLLGSKKLSGKVSAPIVVEGDDGSPNIIVPDLIGYIHCLELSPDNMLRLKWKVRGHGMVNESGICAGRENGSQKYIVYAVPNEKGEARIVKSDLSGQIKWIVDIPLIHHELQTDERGGLMYIHTMPLMQPDTDDVVVTCLKNNQHSGFSIALDGKTGKELWRKLKSGSVWDEKRGYGGSRPFAGYPKEDGTEDIVSEYPDLFYVANGKTGDFTVYNRSQFCCFYDYFKETDVIRSKPALIATPVVIKNKKPESRFDNYEYVVLWGACSFTTGLWVRIKESGGFYWFTPFYHSLNNCPLQGVGDLNGDGRMELIGWENSKQMITVRDLEEGDLIWSMPLPEGNSGYYYVTCDINGDGKEECIVCTPEKLYALGEKNGNGTIAWSKDMPQECRQPVVADVDGDGFSEILLPCYDGYLYLIH